MPAGGPFLMAQDRLERGDVAIEANFPWLGLCAEL